MNFLALIGARALRVLQAFGHAAFFALELMREWRLDSYRYERGWATRAASALDATTQPPDWARIGRAAAHLS